MEKYRYEVVSREETAFTLKVKLAGKDDALCPPASLTVEFRKWFDSERRNLRYPSSGFEIGDIVELSSVEADSG